MATIVKRKTGFMYQIYLGKDEHGKAKFESKGSFKTKGEAKEAASLRELELKNGESGDLTEITFESFAKRWLATKEMNLRYNTFFNYRERIRLYMLPLFGRKKMKDVKVIHIQDWHQSMSKTHSMTTVADAHKLMKRIFKDAVSWEVINKNPFDKIPTPTSKFKTMETWTKEDVATFLQGSKDDAMYMAFYLALATGMRQSEILGLTWDNVSFEHQYITVNSVLETRSKQLINDTKTKSSSRRIDCSHDLMNELKKHRTRQKQMKLIAGTAWQNHYDLVITTGFGTPIVARNLLRSFTRLKKKLGLKEITFHELRHTHASLLLQNKVHPKIVSERLGHSTIKMTLDVYSHLIPTMQKEAADLFDQLLQSESKKVIIES